MYIKSDEMVIALEPGEDVRTVLRVFADEIFKASPKFNEYATDFDPSLVMTEEFADSFIHEYNGMLRLNMDNGHVRSYKVGIKQTAQGLVWGYTSQYVERHPHDTAYQLFSRVQSRLHQQKTELPKQQPQPMPLPSGLRRILVQRAGWHRVSGAIFRTDTVNQPASVFNFASIEEARKDDRFRLGVPTVVDSREAFMKFLREVGFPIRFPWEFDSVLTQ